MERTAELIVDGRPYPVSLEPDRSLLVVLREELGMTGAKYGCGEGACGACTVLLDGSPVRSCVTPIGEAAGRSVTTIEGLATGGLHPVQWAFLEERAMQCGYCTPGMVMCAVALLQANPHPDDAQIVEAMNGNLCRCCAYPRILRAIRRASDVRPGPVDVVAEDDAPPLLTRPQAPWNLTGPGDRDWFDVLPDGLILVLPPDALPRAWTASGGAWIHVAGDGRITAFTGKVDVGQDNRTALARLVAEELRVETAAVRVVMGDTDLCPWDAGTFGSRSMPDAGPVLATTAAGAREQLLRLAADRLEVDTKDLEASDGRVTVVGTDRSVGFGELAGAGRRVKTIAGTPTTTPPERWRDPGVDAPSHHAMEAVTGRRRFPTDHSVPGMQHGRVLRPPAIGALLRALDASGAEAMPGVTVVHDGDFVAVAAPDPHTADRALEALRAEWETPRQPGDRELERHLRAHPTQGEGWSGAHLEEEGDVNAGLADADVRLEATYTTAFVQHVPLETRVALAQWDGHRVTVWAGTQRPFGVREQVAEALDVPEKDVRVIVPPTGTGFGGKHSADVAIEAARLARAAGRPVKVRWTREEEFTWAYFRPAAVIDVRSGASRDGRITAWDYLNINSGAAGIGLPYDVGNTRIRYQPAQSPLPQGSYRALAATANAFARESHLDELAHELGVNPLAFRLANLSDERLRDVLQAAADHAGWARGPAAGDAQRGMGIALGFEKEAYVGTVAEVAVGPEGAVSVTRIVTACDCGAVVSPNSLRNQIEGATIMGLGGALFEQVRFEDGRILNASLNDYRVPRFADVPEIEVLLIDRKDESPAGGGETPIITVAPAIANAIFAATGRRIRSMPLVPGRPSE
jgi:nicotinate dehydrogenase subunit B